MKSRDLSILIPARNEMWLSRTVEDILKNKQGNTEIIIGLDGQWADPVIEDHPDVTIIHTSESIGQRAMTNQCARLSNAKYLAKVDAHCAFDKGFDVKLMDKMQDDWTMVPVMLNLWVFDWKCPKCGERWYQGPTPCQCPKCHNTKDIYKKMVWKGKTNPASTSYCFDPTPHFQYFREYKKTDQYQKDVKTGLTETMSLQGSFFMCSRKKYWELDLCDEDFGSWGSQGIEVACKTWLSGGRVVVNHSTWYAHLFRTQGGDFGFPYLNPGSKVQAAKKYAKEMFFEGKWGKAKKPLSWLIEKFWPVPRWTEKDLSVLKERENGKNR